MNIEHNIFLAAEDCPPQDFERYHLFVEHDERLIRALMAHGPVLIKGGRGVGKSALMLEASRRMSGSLTTVGIYISLRYLPLLRTTGSEYLTHFAKLTSAEISKKLKKDFERDFPVCLTIEELKVALSNTARITGRRIVLLFDDAAHIGRESSLDEFFDSFRMLSSSDVSCKASIYPGVTKFGVRFDIYNDATVLDITKDERASNFNDFFYEVLYRRKSEYLDAMDTFNSLTKIEVVGFVARSVLGNMRAFIIAADKLEEQGRYNGVPSLRSLLMTMAGDYFWPLLDEVRPKLGVYEPMADISQTIAEQLFGFAGTSNNASLVIKKEICQSIAKPFEILEYLGFISKREASRAIQGGGRGPRYSLNLATLFEKSRTKQLSNEIVNLWLRDHTEVLSISGTNNPINVEMPSLTAANDLTVFSLDVTKLEKSNAYPYGLTEDKIQRLKDSGFLTIGSVAQATDDELDRIPLIGDIWVRRIRDVVNQSIWM
jgi:hypothetical protein